VAEHRAFRSRRHRPLGGARLWLPVICFLLALATPLGAHFLLNLNVRIFHVDHRADGLDLYIRMPMPYLVADKVGPPGLDGLPAPAPFTTNRMEDDRLVHHVDFDQLRRNPLGLGMLLADGIRVETDAGAPNAETLDVRVYPLGTEPGFATLGEAIASFDAAPIWPAAGQLVYVGDAVADVHLRVLTGGAVGRYRISSTLDPGLPDQDKTANLVLDNGPGDVQVFRARGLLDDPIEVSRSSLDAFGTFVKEGVRHILEGLDHVLFVLCLVVGAVSISGLLWRVTGFTLGHSVTLSLGFFGFVPSGDWFVPAVELTIAITIIFAAVLAIHPLKQREHGEVAMFAITGFIGLIHGLGFSFVLKNILKISSPNIWQSLVAFNIGIELGQLFIVLSTLLALWSIGKISTVSARRIRVGIALTSGSLACYWVFERGLPLFLLA
jgi:hypothetical protein